jgi:hypothetical protein
MNEFTDDDGFSGSHNSQFIKGIRLGWNSTKHWNDRDGLAVPPEMFLKGIDEALRRWKDGKAEIIDTKPLPRPDDLNSKIPVNEWENGIDGKPTPTWQHIAAFYFINLSIGETYTYASATKGAHFAYEHIRDAVANMRALQSERMKPLVRLSERPMKTKFGPRTRPHLEIIGWKSLGEDGLPLPTPPTPRAGPTPPSAASSSTVPTPQPISPAPRRPTIP